MITEHEIIETMSKIIGNPWEDATVISPKGKMVVNVDHVSVGRDIPPEAPIFALGWKGIVAAASDLIAKGSIPRWFAIAFLFAEVDSLSYADALARGIKAAIKNFHANVVIADTDIGKDNSLSVTAIGPLVGPRFISRSGACPGDIVILPFPKRFGSPLMGFKCFCSSPSRENAEHIRNYLYPHPVPELAPIISRYATASMDSSDGLVYTLSTISASSNAGIEITSIPQHLPPEYVFYSGEEYLPVFTVPPKKLEKVENFMREKKIPFQKIGVVVSLECCQKGEVLYKGNKIDAKGYQHIWKT
ncbi:MAG: thiamine-phosphate kinase [Candidatus Korarchaeota archaeon]